MGTNIEKNALKIMQLLGYKQDNKIDNLQLAVIYYLENK